MYHTHTHIPTPSPPHTPSSTPTLLIIIINKILRSKHNYTLTLSVYNCYINSVYHDDNLYRIQIIYTWAFISKFEIELIFNRITIFEIFKFFKIFLKNKIYRNYNWFFGYIFLDLIMLYISKKCTPMIYIFILNSTPSNINKKISWPLHYLLK